MGLLASLRADSAGSITELLERTQDWCAKQSFNLTYVRDAYRQKAHYTQELEDEFRIPCDLDQPEQQCQAKKVYLVPGCTCCSSARDDPEVRVYGIHLFHLLGLQCLLGLVLSASYFRSVWWRSHRLCPCVQGGTESGTQPFFCIFGNEKLPP